ncbi:MAG: cyclic lactone autoinducer peptide [Clostridiales bacterium]|nr:cyclic lactone autoinducer peptide [Clostridiales bacterium]MCF8022323.1 cyclic lactone autoinducer peptide [Clostridiales bacterium]
MKRLTCWLLSSGVAALVFLANVTSASACVFGHYQPEVPKSLQK